MATYSGPVGFGSDGVHYPVVDNPDDIDPDTNQPRTHLDTSRPLRWIEGDGGWRDAEDGDPLHNDVHHENEVVFEVGGEG